MSHQYLDIRLLPDPELPPHVLMAALFTKLHKALSDLKEDQIGVCFPEYAKDPARLGDHLRLIGPRASLARLMEGSWLGALQEQISSTAIASVPEGAEQRALRRVQAKSSPARLRRRQMKRHGLNEAEALERVPDHAAEFLRLPFVQLFSASTGQTFRLFLDLSEPQGAGVQGVFNAYGLSSTATIPCF
ncbi:type I-F CRISPR-associated endoribonuclease Cas6/Csy4 [Roseateles albus]|uniref:Type I-F CRISPR-associated endoribonuclease Cas6/Csy4 n=1 Tax=Roseateles albus TaxID=2987525 RepID=A0ABT5KI23_9BURK|nr:type I-F CRISPR-associated endoribonuclease Cas6/Csy4 [Roseateles albus]MDC8773558.1 type I-F CRISPR-associated endoribonuclease Cas6/Csy4 [Roseateles albus]